MKTHTIKTPTAELMIVELQTEVINSSYHIQKTPKGILIKDDTGEKFISNKYTLLGKPDEIKEEDARKLVQYLTRRDLIITPKNYSKGKDGRFEDITFTESLLSLIETEIYWDVNPEGKFPRYAFDENINPKDIKARAYHQKWYEAKQKTFDRNRSIIFKKNK